MYSRPFPAAAIRALVLASNVIASRPAVCSRAGAEVLISSFAANGQEGATDGDISDPLIVIGPVLEMVPTTEGEIAVPAIRAEAATIAGKARRETMS
jgi:hypothetical protein